MSVKDFGIRPQRKGAGATRGIRDLREMETTEKEMGEYDIPAREIL